MNLSGKYCRDGLQIQQTHFACTSTCKKKGKFALVQAIFNIIDQVNIIKCVIQPPKVSLKGFYLISIIRLVMLVLW